MKSLFMCILTAITGMAAYGFAALVGTIIALQWLHVDLGVLIPMVAIATMMGVDAHDPGERAFVRQGVALVGALIVTVLPSLIYG